MSLNLPDELAQGLFQRPDTYAAKVRFSNSVGQKNSDWMPDGRGLAIKVHGAQGERADINLPDSSAQDFLMVNHSVFIARNVKDYLRLEELLANTSDRPLTTLLGALTGGNWNPLAWHWNEAITVANHGGRLQVEGLRLWRPQNSRTGSIHVGLSRGDNILRT